MADFQLENEAMALAFCKGLSRDAQKTLARAINAIIINEPWLNNGSPDSAEKPSSPQRRSPSHMGEANPSAAESRRPAHCVVVYGSIALDLVAEVSRQPAQNSNSKPRGRHHGKTAQRRRSALRLSQARPRLFRCTSLVECNPPPCFNKIPSFSRFSSSS